MCDIEAEALLILDLSLTCVPILLIQEGDLVRTASFADDGEILDGIVTRSRGEIRRIGSSKVLMSSTSTPSKDLAVLQSPRLQDKVHSPRVAARGPFSPKYGEAKPSNLSKWSWLVIWYLYICRYEYKDCHWEMKTPLVACLHWYPFLTKAIAAK